MKTLRADYTLVRVNVEISSEDFDSQIWKYIRTGTICETNAKLMKKYLTSEQHGAFVHDAMLLAPLAFEIKLVKFNGFSDKRKQLILDIWEMYEQAVGWAGSLDPDDADEFHEDMIARRERLLKMAWRTLRT